MEPYRFTAGRVPLLVSMPHVGTYVPPEVEARLDHGARGLPDTDWHVDRLYDFLEDLGASVLRATHSRYVIDLNRAADGKPLYPGASETELCPVTTFADQPIYRPGQAPGPDEIAQRRADIWRPYHDCLAGELDALKARHGIALLWDAHSIRSEVPRFFDGRLPDLNFGTGNGISAAAPLVERLMAVARDSTAYSHVLNGRFKGGYITRAYGAPLAGVHAVQLELSQITYMDEDPPFGFREDLAAGIRPLLRQLLEAALAWAQANSGPPGRAASSSS
jgi:N-formylglutamate deformylase